MTAIFEKKKKKPLYGNKQKQEKRTVASPPEVWTGIWIASSEIQYRSGADVVHNLQLLPSALVEGAPPIILLSPPLRA